DSNAYRLLTGDGTLIDALRRIQPNGPNGPNGEDEATFHGYGRQEEMAAIDWILVSDHFRVLDAQIDRSRQDNLFPSDHYPITAVLDWKA
ncbi:MAG: hypothetical protein KKH22_00325, partial [Proteobacteria bacterium]|nr:hypothetical protein [Pseudomonadota bacterium]